MMQNLIVALVLAIGAYFIMRSVAARRARIPPQEAHAKVEAGALLLDVRTEREHASGSIEGALNIPLQRLGASLGELPKKEREIVVFCASGMRSARAAAILRRAGYTAHDLGPEAAW